MEFAPKSSESSPGSVTETSAETGVDTKKAAAQTIKTKTKKQLVSHLVKKGYNRAKLQKMLVSELKRLTS